MKEIISLNLSATLEVGTREAPLHLAYTVVIQHIRVSDRRRQTRALEGWAHTGKIVVQIFSCTDGEHCIIRECAHWQLFCCGNRQVAA